MVAIITYSIPSFHPSCVDAVNTQINASMTTMYFYTAMVKRGRIFLFKFAQCCACL